MSMEDEPMFKHRRLYGSAFASEKLNIRSDSFVPQSRPTRRTLIALFAAFLIAFSGAQASQAADVPAGTYDGDSISEGDHIRTQDASDKREYTFNGDTTFNSDQDVIAIAPGSQVTINMADSATLTLNASSNNEESGVKASAGSWFELHNGHLNINAGGVNYAKYALDAWAGAQMLIYNESVLLQNAEAGLLVKPDGDGISDGADITIETGSLTIKDVFQGIHTEGTDTEHPSMVTIDADTVSITAVKSDPSYAEIDQEKCAAIYSINKSENQPDSISIIADTSIYLEGGLYSIYQTGRNELGISAPTINAVSDNFGLYLAGANNVSFYGDDVRIAGMMGDGMRGLDNNYGAGNEVKISAAKSLSVHGGTYGLYSSISDDGRDKYTFFSPNITLTAEQNDGIFLQNSDLTMSGSETELAKSIIINGAHSGLHAFRNAKAELNAEKITITGGDGGVAAVGANSDGGSVKLNAAQVAVKGGRWSVYTTDSGTVTVGKSGALVRLSGNVQSGTQDDDGGTAVLNLDAAGSFLKGQSYGVDWDSRPRDNRGATRNLGDGAYWSFSGESTMRFLNGNGGEVRMQNGTTGDKANIGTLSGKGAFLLDTDIAADTADSVFAKTGSGADYGILVKNSGDAPDRERMTQYLVKTADSGGTFSLLNRGGLVEAGIWAYSLASENVADGKQWYLERAGLVPEDPEPTPDEKPNAPAPNPGTGSDKPTPAPDPGTEPDEPAPAPDAPITADELSSTAQAALGSIVSPFIWYIEVDSLYKRIDEYTPDYEGGAWFRAFGKKEYYDNGLVDGVKQEYGGMSAGYDWVKAYDDGAKLYYGFMLGYGEGEREISFGSNDFDSKHFSLYGIYKKPNKFYVAGILKYNRYGSDFDLTESAYRRVEGDFDQNGYGASVQVGREFSLGNGWFWEPQLQFSVLRIEGDSYRTSGSPNAIIDVDMGDTDSVRLRGGLVLGREIINDDGSKFRGYVKASIQHEFDEKTDIWLDRRLFVSDLSGTWGSYGLGLQYRAKHGQSLFFDFEYGCGEKREQPWAVQLGYRIEM